MTLYAASRRAVRLNRNHTLTSFIRFLSSKKSDSVLPDQAPPKIPLPDSATVDIKGEESAKSKKASVKTTSSHASTKYFSFDELPKAPQSVIDQVSSSSKLFPYKSRSIFEAENEDIQQETFSHNFSILPHDISPGPLRTSTSEVWHRINNIPSFSSVPEHPLKKSITGIFDINPRLKEINDELLWRLCPQGNMFENAPFDGDPSFKSVKKYEQKRTNELKEQFASTLRKAKELKDFESTLYSANSFVRPRRASSVEGS